MIYGVGKQSFQQSMVDIISAFREKKRRVHAPFRGPSTVDNLDDYISILSDSRRTKAAVRFLFRIERRREIERERERERETETEKSEHKAETFATRGCPCALIFRSTELPSSADL